MKNTSKARTVKAQIKSSIKSLLIGMIAAVIRAILKLDEFVFEIKRKKTTPPFPYDKTANSIRLPKHLENELRLLLKQGNKVEVVKRVTRLSGAGLRLSKDYVDNLEKSGQKMRTYYEKRKNF